MLGYRQEYIDESADDTGELAGHDSRGAMWRVLGNFTIARNAWFIVAREAQRHLPTRGLTKLQISEWTMHNPTHSALHATSLASVSC